MKIHGAEGMTPIVIRDQILRGAKFVVYEYCFSFLFMTVRRRSPIYFIKSDENSFTNGFVFSLFTILFGWWGLPWGPLRTCECLLTNFGGGKNITQQILAEVYTFREMSVS